MKGVLSQARQSGRDRVIVGLMLLLLCAWTSESLGVGEKEAALTKAPYKVLYNNDTTNTMSCVSPWHKRGGPFTKEKLLL